MKVPGTKTDVERRKTRDFPRFVAPFIPLLAVVLVILVVSALLFSRATLSSELAKDELFERIMNSGVLRVGMDASFPPFEWYGEDQRLMGFDVDLADELARRMNLRAEFVNAGFDTLYEGLFAQHYDISVSALPYDRLRTRDVAYSDIYFRGGEMLVVRSDERKVNKLEDLRGEKLAVELASSAETLAKKMERRYGYRTISFTTLDEAVLALERSEVRALMTDAVSARLLRRAHPQLMLVGEPLSDEPNFVIALPVNAPSLLTAINKHLRAMEKEGTLAWLRDKWF